MATTYIYPDGKVTYSNKESPSVGPSSLPSKADMDEWAGNGLENESEAFQAWGKMARIDGLIFDRKGEAPLGLSIETNFTATERKKAKSMQSKARNRTKQSLYVMERVVPRDCMTFFTGTAPSRIADKATTSEWSRVIDIFRKKVRRRLEAQGIGFMDCHVFEVHPDRSIREGKPILHLHSVFVGRKRYNHWAITPEEYTAMWKESWEAVLPEESKDEYWGASTNVQRVKKSVGAYFAKYLAKGSNPEMEEFLDNQPDEYFPRNWVSMSRNLTRLLRENTFRYIGRAATSVIDTLRELWEAGQVKWYPVFLDAGDGTCFDIAGAFYGLDPPGIRYREW